MAWPVYLYVPNLIGYLRILASFYAMAVALEKDSTLLFISLYLASFIGDYFDGFFATLLNQKSTFGAVLDMVTDRVSTACLLIVLSHLYPPHFFFFLCLIALDIFSHWFQMYSSFLLSRLSHKDTSDKDHILMRLYYANRTFMGYCCIGAEVLYLALFLLHHSSTMQTDASILEQLRSQSAKEHWSTEFSLSVCLGAVALPGWAFKQIINVVQLKQAADACVLHDFIKKQQGRRKTE